ncbi:hypothetical protein V2G26_019822 [Clonostachys chloroleuca]
MAGPISSPPVEVNLSFDDMQLRAQGHEAQLPRRFSLISILAFSYSIMNSWLGFVSVLLATLLLGGPTTAFWGTIVAWVASVIIATGLAELASAFPSSGGSYHFTFSIAPQQHRAAIYTAQSIVGLAGIRYPDYEVQRWRVWAVYAACLILGTALVTIAPVLVPKTQSTFFAASISGWLVTSIAVLAMSKTKQSARDVLINWDNQAGWDSGFAFTLGVGQCMWSVTHIAEEISHPGKNVSRAMLLAMLIGLLTIVFFALALLIFSCTDFSAISASAVPLYEAYFQATGSTVFSTVLVAWITFVYFGVVLGLVTTSGRLIWACSCFPRDRLGVRTLASL